MSHMDLGGLHLRPRCECAKFSSHLHTDTARHETNHRRH